MDAARALEIETEFYKEIPERFYSAPAGHENAKGRLAYEAARAVQQYRRYLLREEAGQFQEREKESYGSHDICSRCGAHLDADEKCDCQKTSA